MLYSSFCKTACWKEAKLDLRLAAPHLSLPYIHLSSTGMSHMNLPWKLRSCRGSQAFSTQDSGEHSSMSAACTLPLSLHVLTPLNWACSLPWNRKSCLGERGITSFRNTSHPARAGKEKMEEKKKKEKPTKQKTSNCAAVQRNILFFLRSIWETKNELVCFMDF